MGEYGHEKARRFGWDVVASQIVEVYEEARAAHAAHRGVPAAPLEELNVHDAV
jgi:hypothetical protein